VSGLQATYVRAADLFRQVLRELGAADLTRPVPSCPGWTVSDVVTHVNDNHVTALGPERADADDLMAAYALAIPDDPALAATAPFDTLDLTLHAWDVALACGVELRLGDDQLRFLEVFAREAGERLYVGGEFAPADLDTVDPTTLDRQGVALLPYGRQVRTSA
jgi:hypothetical protein